ncbi:hypothetical protein tb265_12260 [Gemmatimonadetes bacterium T265]|nr:hypothetical protein tb265_12260 [Gemmatimonadetes bacterium T265]
MPLRRAPRLLPAALLGAASFLAVDGRCASGAVAPATPPADTATVRRAADLVRRARDAERAAATGGTRGPNPAVGNGPNAAPATAAPLPLDPVLADSARRTYLAAATLVPAAADWLRLRAAGVTRDREDRAALLRTLTTPAARERAPLTDALARARGGDLSGAANALDSLGRPAQALSLRLWAATDPSARVAVRTALLGLLHASTAGPATPPDNGPGLGVAESSRERARTAALVLDSAFATDPVVALAPAERLSAARVLADARDPGTLRRAAAGFASARASLGATAPDDVRAEAGVLARLGRWRDAAAAYARAPGPAAAYERARALLRAGDLAAARAALRALTDAAPRDGALRDTAAANAGASAGLLLAELAADDGDDAAARLAYERVAREQPGTRSARPALFRAGLLALTANDARGAAADLDDAARPGAPAPVAGDSARGPSGFADSARDENAALTTAGTYWAGRAWAAAGDAAAARARWAQVLARDPSSYYAWLAARRLGRPWRLPEPAADASPPAVDPAAEAAADRAALLERLGLTPEAGYERDYLIRSASGAPERMLAVAHALARGPRPGPGIRLAARAVERGAPRTAAVWQLLDPLLYADALCRSAAAVGVDPALAAGVIRQESNFTADAVSPVGARGLMQLMPDVGRALWRGEGAAAWTPDLLFVPDVNLALGMRHLAAGLRGYPDPAYALAAYNAGGARVARWRRQPGADDAELFVERIPFAETRDYVRIVLRNRELYRALYRL